MRVRHQLARFTAMRARHKLACLAALPLLGLGGWLVLRDSALFAVDHVSVVGLSRNALPAVSDQLLAAARAQTTTDFSTAALRSSVARYTLIDDVAVQTQFPHGVRIEVHERHPIAWLDVAGQGFALADDGSVITGLAHAGPLAVLHSVRYPWNGHSRDPFVLLALRVLIDAPAPLRHRVAAVTIADGALTIHLHRGPRLIFGNEALLHAKWDAAAAVLADASSRGASYIDLRLPSRPAAQVADPATNAASAASVGSSAATPANAATVATALNPSLIQPSSSTSG
ncbi:MAG TPA: FtsQ-type POTRA domain-containing protein [Solirubrobacteraceae bacterium]|nr:FtsQ-type POTRA domain-containing protein [Solirubrobacteraceae bacterium]